MRKECVNCDGDGEVVDPRNDEDVFPCPECAGTGWADDVDDDDEEDYDDDL